VEIRNWEDGEEIKIYMSNKNFLIIMMFLFIFITAGCISVDNEKNKTENKEKAGNRTVFTSINMSKIEVFEKSRDSFNFSQPYISCISKTCKGNFTLIAISSEENLISINETINTYGRVTGNRCYGGECIIFFISHEINIADNLINLPSVEYLFLNKIESDYMIRENNLYFCKEDKDCIKVTDGCCGCGGAGRATSINRKYENLWKSYEEDKCRSSVCAASMSHHISCFSKSACTDNSCSLVIDEDFLCNSSSLLFINCRNGHREEESLDKVFPAEGISCREVLRICNSRLN